jgi:hypothetical protein
MTRAGRKRNSNRERYACGKPKPPKPVHYPDQPHRRGYGSNPLAETTHGRYLLDKAITAPQHAAGAWYGRSRLRYRAAIGSPDSLRSRDEGHPEDGEERDDARAIAEYQTARAFLGRFTTDVEWVVCLDAQLADLTAYRKGLDVLRRFYGV